MRKVRLLAFHNANLLDIAGPVQTLASASQYAMRLGERAEASYELGVISMAGGLVMSSAAAAIETQRAQLEDLDTFLVAGGHGAEAACRDAKLLDFVRAQSGRARRTGSICTGALVLAQAGLLDGRRATTHWGYCAAMQKQYPKVEVLPDALFVVDGPIWSSAGVLAGVDMAMAMVERDLGRRMADYTARALVASQRRSLGAPQLSAQLKAQEVEVGRIRALMEWIADNPRADLSTAALAERAALSTRSLHRHFQSEAHQTPAAFVERVRVDAAQRLLAKTDYPPERVASNAGFGSLTAMRRAFVRVLALTPTQYRRQLA